MSYTAERWAREQTVGNSTAKAVLRELAYCHNGETGLCCPSINTIARVLEIKKSDTVTAAIRRLEDGGFVSRVFIRDPETGQILRTEYSLLGFDASEWTYSKNQDTSHENRGTSPKKQDTVTQETGGGSPEKGGEGSPKKRGVTRKSNQEGEHRNRTNKEEPPDLFSNDVKEIEKPKKTTPRLVKPEGVSDEVWTEWTAHKRKVCKSCSQRAVDNIVREAAKAGMTVEEAMIYQLEKGWKGFEADWITDKRPNKRSTNIRFEGHDNDFSCIYG